MRKKLTLVLILTLVAFTGYAQKIQIKDGIITKDKEPVAKLEGDAGLIKGIHIKIKSLTDETLIRIDEKLVSYHSHFQEPEHFTTVTFVPFNQTINVMGMSKYNSEKKIIALLYDKIGKNFLTKDGLNKDLVAAYVTSGDETKKINDDTLKIGNVVSKYHAGLKEPVPSRDIKGPMRLSSFSEDKLKWKGYVGNSGQYFDRTFSAIYQGNELLGVLVKVLVKGAVDAPFYNSARYYILKKITPVDINGEMQEYAPLSQMDIESSGGLSTKIKIEHQGMRVPPKVVDFRNAENTLIDLLILEGLL